MSYDEEIPSEVDEIDAEVATSEEQQQGLFLGDYGELAYDTRRALVKLLTGPAIEGVLHQKLWQILIRDQRILQRYLSELFLELVIDRDHQVAFTRQADTGDLDTPLLLRRTKLTFLDSILLLYLRQQLTQSEARGEKAVVSLEEALDYLRLYEKMTSTDRAGFGKKSSATIEKMKKYNILQKIRGSENRFEISASLKIIFSATEIQALTQIYNQMLNSQEDIK